jgi:heme-degrading monooxygenase HmoA
MTMARLADTPEPPYFAVIFTSQASQVDTAGYARTAQHMLELAKRQPGYLGIEETRDEDGVGITVSYWESLEAIEAWKNQADHLDAQRLGRERWYSAFRLRIAHVERATTWEPPKSSDT